MADTSRHTEQQHFTDQELVTQTLANKQVFAAIVRRYEAPLLRYITRLGCRDTSTAQDLLQEIFIKTYIHLNDYDHSLQFSSWIYRIAHNEIISSFRKEKHVPSVLERDADFFLFDKVVDELELTDQDGQKHSAVEIQAAVDRLDPRSREIIVLKFFEEKHYEAISDILQIPEGTVATMISRAKKKIKNYLEES
jgi:RNA polymerase sigma-70 factor (ECF subfamily)